jgi:hypothetical protein
MKFDSQKVTTNARSASTEDLLDRVTVFREGMEAEALGIFEAELRQRGITRAAIEAHACANEGACLRDADGVALQCRNCRKAAVIEAWGWQRLWNLVPIFPRRFRYCEEHRPDGSGDR